MGLHIANREVNGMAVLALGGRIVLGDESSALRKNVNGLLAKGNKKILLNVDRVGYIDSAGLGMLVAMYRDAKSQGASLALCHLGSHFEGVMQITKLLTVFDTYKTEADAVKLANDTEFGLAAYFYGRDITRVWRVAEALEYGIVGINAGIISTEVAPFGGVKESGLGREGSKYGMDEYVEIKYLCFGGITP